MSQDSIIIRFFGELSNKGVRYCHWKSNAALEEALSGKTDLDLLIDESSRNAFEKALETFDFKKIISPPEKQYPGMEDYLGFDPDSGALFHLHVHYKLIFGGIGNKDYHLPIEDVFLSNTNSYRGVTIPEPELELLLLYLRAHLKLNPNHFSEDRTGSSIFPPGIKNEFFYLFENLDSTKLSSFISETNLDNISAENILEFLARLKDETLTQTEIWKARDNILDALLPYKRKNISKHATSQQRKKTLPGKGKVFALVGPDGSGKTTLATELTSWLSWKLDVTHIYFGLPRTDYWYRFFTKCISLIRKYNKLVPELVAISETKSLALVYYVAAKKRYKNYLKSLKIKDSGGVVITDRYPLEEFIDMPRPMDGPRIRRLVCTDWLADSEEQYYEKIQKPDYVFLLKADYETLRARKADLSQEEHKQKVKAVDNIEDSGCFISIDATKPIDEVYLELKRQIWKAL